MCSKVIPIFNGGVVLDYLNDTLITLISKCQYLKSLSNYRPISFCNTVYKVVSKIIVGRVRPLISKLISPAQATFVPGRKGIDNVVIAQELFYTMDRKKGKQGYMAIKWTWRRRTIGWSRISSIKYFKPSNSLKISYV